MRSLVAIWVSALQYLLHIAITTTDWDRLFELLSVLLDTSSCSLVMILTCTCKC